jgi:hypothetical protein
LLGRIGVVNLPEHPSRVTSILKEVVALPLDRVDRCAGISDGSSVAVV